jgi:hypothetical protein
MLEEHRLYASSQTATLLTLLGLRAFGQKLASTNRQPP